MPELYPRNDSVTSLRCHLLISPVINLEASVADIFTLMKTDYRCAPLIMWVFMRGRRHV